MSGRGGQDNSTSSPHISGATVMDERRDRLKFYCITELDRPARELIR